jgi:hypothetical protein
MKRRLFNLLAAVSLIVSMNAATFWLFAPRASGWWVERQGPSAVYIFSVRQSHLTIQRANITPIREAPETHRGRWFGGVIDQVLPRLGCFEVTDSSIWSRLGLIRTMERIPHTSGLDRPDIRGVVSANTRSVIIPLWIVSIVTGIPPIRAAVRIRKERIRTFRVKRGLCGGCGYDLRASKERCPECGMAIPTEQRHTVRL